jgi:hypothetical protein
MKSYSEEKSILKLVILLVILLFLLMYSYAHAVDAVSKGKSEVSQKPQTNSLLDLITGNGSASILESVDIEEAKEKALEMAKNEAVLKVVGLYVNSEVLTKEKENILKTLKPKQDEVIDKYDIISEEKGEDGFYRVKINARVKEETVKTLLMKNLYDDRVIVVTSEKNLGNVLKRHILEHELINRIKNKGYLIVDYRTLKNDKRVRQLESAIRQGDTTSVKKMGIYYLTDIVVVGYIESEFSEVTKNIYSAHATGQVKIHRVGSEKEIVSLTKHNVKGFGSDEEKAGLDALKKISNEIAEEGVKGLPKKSIKQVKLIIREIGSYSSFRKAKSMISTIPYVNEVRDGLKNFDIEETALYVRTTKSIDYLADRISELKKFVIKHIGESDIVLEARKI